MKRRDKEEMMDLNSLRKDQTIFKNVD